MAEARGLLTPGFLAINLQFALVTAIAALFFAFSGYLQLLGLKSATIGFILSADALAALIVQPLIAPVVHAGTARHWLVGGCLVLSLSLALLARAVSVPVLITVRLLQGAGFICVLTALIALLVEFIPPAMSGRAFGWVSLVRLIPYAAVPLLFDLFALAPSSFPRLLHAAAGVALMPILILLFPAARRVHQNRPAPPPGLAGMAASLRTPAVRLLLLSALLFFSGYAAIFFFLKQFAQIQGLTSAGLFFTTATLMMIATRLFGSWLFDRCNKMLLCAGGLVLVSLCYLLLPLCASDPVFTLLAGTAGLGWGVAMPLQAAAMFDLSPPADRAMNQNLLVVMMQGGFFLGPFLGGVILARSGFPLLFIALAGLTLAAAAIPFRLRDTPSWQDLSQHP